jgi:hypothetical protein
MASQQGRDRQLQPGTHKKKRENFEEQSNQEPTQTLKKSGATPIKLEDQDTGSQQELPVHRPTPAQQPAQPRPMATSSVSLLSTPTKAIPQYLVVTHEDIGDLQSFFIGHQGKWHVREVCTHFGVKITLVQNKKIGDEYRTIACVEPLDTEVDKLGTEAVEKCDKAHKFLDSWSRHAGELRVSKQPSLTQYLPQWEA